MDAQLEARLASIEKRLTREEDHRAISNLMGRYQYLMTGGQNDVIARELFAYDAPGAHCEYGPLGMFYGEKSVEFFDQVNRNLCGDHADRTNEGTLEIHEITTPVIEIADDGKTAKGMWLSTGVMMSKPDADGDGGFFWDVGKYAVDFIKTDAGWKIWHLHVCDMWRTPFGTDPVANAGTAESGVTQAMIDDYNARKAGGEDVRPMGFPIPDAPTTFHYMYSSDSPAPREPKAPAPYKTFDETFSY